MNDRKYKPDQIVIMSRLAKYDKNQRREDEKILKYFRHDYIYSENMKTRIAVLIALGILFLFYLINGFNKGSIDLASLNILEHKKELFTGIFIVSITLIVYTFISTIKSTREYQEASRRMVAYLRTLEILDERRQLEKMKIDKWDDREMAKTRIIPKREVPHE